MDTGVNAYRNHFPLIAGSMAILLGLVQIAGITVEYFKLRGIGDGRFAFEMLAFQSIALVGIFVSLAGGVLLILHKPAGWFLAFMVRSSSICGWIHVFILSGNWWQRVSIGAIDFLYFLAPNVIGLLLTVVLLVPATTRILPHPKGTWILFSAFSGIIYFLLILAVQSFILPLI